MRAFVGNMLFITGSLVCMTGLWILVGDVGAKAWAEHMADWHKRVSGAR